MKNEEVKLAKKSKQITKGTATRKGLINRKEENENEYADER